MFDFAEAVALFATQALLVVLLMFLAFIGETLVEYLLGTWLPRVVKDADLRKVIYQLSAGVIGLVFAFVFSLDLIGALVLIVKEMVKLPYEATTAMVVVGYICTGLMMGRGSNFLHDLAKKWFGLRSPPKPDG